MSATVDIDVFRDYFENAVVEKVSGREWGVDILYLKEPPLDPHVALVDIVLQIHLTEQSGDILVFVSGVKEILKVIRGVQKALSGDNPSFSKDVIGPLDCYPLYSQLPAHKQAKAIDSVAPGGYKDMLGRKLLVATNIAETSMTLVSVTHVIDSCRAKVKIWDPRTESWTLQDMWTSKAVASQRSGRAGRTKKGKCYRTVTKEGLHSQLTDHSVPVMHKTDMVSECLEILAWD